MNTKNETKPKSTETSKPTSKAKDLPAKKDAKGGRAKPGVEPNHNETLACA